MPPRFQGLWQNPNFLKFWAGQTISVVGSNITGLALPLIATVTLNASPEQMGVLSALGQVAYLLVGLPAGAWIDRAQRLPILIAADIGRALCIGLVPLVAFFGLLRMEYLYAIALLAGVLTVFFELSYLAFVPVLVSREHVVEANSKLESSRSAAQIVSPGLAGLLIQVIGAPLALVIDALSFLLSAASLLWMRVEESKPEIVGPRPALWADIREGIRVVVRNPLLRALTFGTAIFNFFAGMIDAILVLFMVRELGLGAANIGIIFTIAGPGTLFGALMARRITERVGIGPAITGSMMVGAAAMALVPLARPPALVAMGFLALSWGIMGASVMVFNINVLSLRQSITPDRLLGRVGATARFVVMGILPLGAVLGGIIAGQIGLRPTLVIAVIGGLFSGLFFLFSPVVRLRRTEDAIAQYAVQPQEERPLLRERLKPPL
ncbi:MAG: MFS transporter [Ardenticatenales bacterium]|nr:MFS transporter [Ardenticatenales bacterium]